MAIKLLFVCLIVGFVTWVPSLLVLLSMTLT